MNLKGISIYWYNTNEFHAWRKYSDSGQVPTANNCNYLHFECCDYRRNTIVSFYLPVPFECTLRAEVFHLFHFNFEMYQNERNNILHKISTFQKRFSFVWLKSRLNIFCWNVIGQWHIFVISKYWIWMKHGISNFSKWECSCMSQSTLWKWLLRNLI